MSLAVTIYNKYVDSWGWKLMISPPDWIMSKCVWHALVKGFNSKLLLPGWQSKVWYLIGPVKHRSYLGVVSLSFLINVFSLTRGCCRCRRRRLFGLGLFEKTLYFPWIIFLFISLSCFYSASMIDFVWFCLIINNIWLYISVDDLVWKIKKDDFIIETKRLLLFNSPSCLKYYSPFLMCGRSLRKNEPRILETNFTFRSGRKECEHDFRLKYTMPYIINLNSNYM